MYSNAPKKALWPWQKKPSLQQYPNRSIVTNTPDYEVPNNSIKTSKYTTLNFLPLNLMVQFSKLPNVYFLIIGIMQMLPAITISGGFPVIFIPLSLVVGVSAIKDFYQDMKRHNSDLQINKSKTLILKQQGWQETTWDQLSIGNIIKV